MDHEQMLARWRANAAAAGVRLTEEDIERILSRGLLDRVVRFEEIVEEAGANNVAPDYLHVLSVYSSGAGQHDE